MLLQALRSISYPLVNSNWSYSPETHNLGQIRWFLEPCELEIWHITFKNNRTPLLSIIKLYASLHHHMWIQTGVTVWKRLNWVCDLCELDLWPLTLTFCMHVTSVAGNNIIKISWWYNDGNIVKKVWRTDRRADGRTEPFIELLGRI